MIYSGIHGDVFVKDLDILVGPEANDELAVALGERRAIGGIDNNNYHVLQMMGIMQQQLTTMQTGLESVTTEVRNNSNNFRGHFGRFERNMNRFINRPFQIIRNNNNRDNNHNNNNQNNNNNNNDQNNNIDGDNNFNINNYNGLDAADGEEVGGGRVGGPPILKLLSNRPATLEELWDEWAVGLHGNKAAKDFTNVERGADKFRYCRRKVFWDCVRENYRIGRKNPEDTITIIRQCYGAGLSVTEILKGMQKDKKNGGHVNLRI